MQANVKHVLHFVAGLCFITASTSEWVEIAQRSRDSNLTNSNAQRLKPGEANVLLARETTTPSPQWIEYQRERFAGTSNKNSQKLIISSEDHLQNYAEVVVPAKTAGDFAHSVQRNTSSRNQYFQTKTQLNIANKEQLATSVSKANKGPKKRPAAVEPFNFQRGLNNHEGVESADGLNDDDTDDDSTANQNGMQQLPFPSLKGFIKFLKSLRRTWLRKSTVGIEDKMNMLIKLRDNLLSNIEDRFTMMWNPSAQKRNKRGILDESNLNFPSEAALISINFLTFAVFLIKLVLQVVHIIKSKHYSFSGFGVNTDTISKTTFGK